MYGNQRWTEAQAQDIDERREPTGSTLSQLAEREDIKDMVLKVRGIRGRDDWRDTVRECGGEGRSMTERETELARNILGLLPGSCCLMDAARILAYAPRPSE